MTATSEGMFRSSTCTHNCKAFTELNKKAYSLGFDKVKELLAAQ